LNLQPTSFEFWPASQLSSPADRQNFRVRAGFIIPA
jgi:hypothetical protein